MTRYGNTTMVLDNQNLQLSLWIDFGGRIDLFEPSKLSYSWLMQAKALKKEKLDILLIRTCEVLSNQFGKRDMTAYVSIY